MRKRMFVKGTAFLARRSTLIREIGEDAFERFVADFAQEEPFFQKPVLASTAIPARTFLTFNDALVKRFYKGDPQTYWQFGERSAEWNFAEGPYRRTYKREDALMVLAAVPAVWKTGDRDVHYQFIIAEPMVPPADRATPSGSPHG